MHTESDELETEALDLIEDIYTLAKEKGFSWTGDACLECDYADEDLISYHDWEIFLDTSNGGVIGVDIINGWNGAWLTYPTDPSPEGFPEFGHLDDVGAIEYARSTINHIEFGLGAARSGKFSWLDKEHEVIIKLCEKDATEPLAWVSWAPDGCLDFTNLYTPELDAWYEFVADNIGELIPSNWYTYGWYLDGIFENHSGGFRCKLSTENKGGFRLQ